MNNQYLKTAETTIDAKNEEVVNDQYSNGFLFGRVSTGYMYQTRSLRIALQDFTLTSENKRVLKNNDLQINSEDLPLQSVEPWRIQKLIKDFYSEKFNVKFSGAKAREILQGEVNFNKLESFISDQVNGFALVYSNSMIKHYAYPFYDLQQNTNNLGMAMMLTSILQAQKEDQGFIYLGGATRPSDKYKLQFKNLQWWDGHIWQDDLESLKKILG
jgi:arginyl-tRNA--protein-N-Asp/Glu arginylyltransferase